MNMRIMWSLVAGLALSAPALAEVRIGYVDVRAVLTESNTGKQFRATLEKRAAESQASLRGEQEKVQNQMKAFDKEAQGLAADQRKQKQKAIEEQLQALQKRVQDADKGLRQQDAEYTVKSIESLRAIVADVAKAEKVQLVLTRGDVLYAENGIDLTQKVMQRFDARPGGK